MWNHNLYVTRCNIIVKSVCLLRIREIAKIWLMQSKVELLLKNLLNTKFDAYSIQFDSGGGGGGGVG